MFNSKVLTGVIAHTPYTKMVYTTPGTYSLELPSDITKVKLTIAGGGGGGAGCIYTAKGSVTWDWNINNGGGGGTGGLYINTISLNFNSILQIIVGSGGNAGQNGGCPSPSTTNGATGKESKVIVNNITYQATGGNGGNRSTTHLDYDDGIYYTQNGSNGQNGTPTGTGGIGGKGGTFNKYGQVTNPAKGANGWVYIEFGEGIE